MPINWKRGSRFSPRVILEQIDLFRTLSPEDGASFSGFELETCLPALQSMLAFPPTADGIDPSVIVWRGLAKVGNSLTPESFLAAANAELSERLATKEQVFDVLYAISVAKEDIPLWNVPEEGFQLLGHCGRWDGIQVRQQYGQLQSPYRSREWQLSAPPNLHARFAAEVSVGLQRATLEFGHARLLVSKHSTQDHV